MMTTCLKRRFLSLCNVLILSDFAATAGVYFIALWLRFDCVFGNIPAGYWQNYRGSIVYSGLLAVIVGFVCHLYHRVWRLASFRELELCFINVAVFSLLNICLVSHFFGTMPISYYLVGGFLQFLVLCTARFGYRFCCVVIPQHFNKGGDRVRKRAMIIGAGVAASMVIREVNSSPQSDSVICCAVDDDPAKLGCSIEGVKIVGGRDCILKTVAECDIEKIFFAIPSLPADKRRNILNICKETRAQLLTLPGIYQLTNKEVLISQMREVSIADLLGRPPIRVNDGEILESLRGKVILVTGGGGSIGSELCRQIAEYSPKQLIIFDVYENNAYDIEQELKRKYGKTLNLTVLIGSVRDTKRINNVFAFYKPEIVFHAAAHKHVPLMETSPCEAIKNNCLGTYKTACAAIAHGTRRFVLISTDKAVNPTNIMGASKRLCEMIIQTLEQLGSRNELAELPNLHSHLNGGNLFDITSPLPPGQHTEFVAVRFGNVLGSNGSVVPLLKKQIAEGGPVTVTSPEIIRYFMTIPEAVSLVLQAETYAKGGEIYVFDMGEPMKIDTLARNLIKLSGLQPDVDIQIKYTGLRPGEKLFEERLMSEEGLRKTANELISIANPLKIDIPHFLQNLMRIAAAAYDNAAAMKQLVAEEVKTYKPDGSQCRQ